MQTTARQIVTRVFSANMNKAGVVFLSCLLAISFKVSNAARRRCYYEQRLADGATYYITNPQFPNAYRGSVSCEWVARSNYRIKLTCKTFDLPSSRNCTQDNLAVRVSNTVTHRYCGSGSFTTESEGDTMDLTLNSPYNSRGGTFKCNIQAITRPTEKKCNCGWKKPTRIVGGIETAINEYPMIAGLIDKTLRELICGATIISERYALTAAHCILNKVTTQMGLLVGEHDLSTGAESNATRLYKIGQLIPHPQFDLEKNQNDIAIVKTIEMIVFSAEVGPACLPFQHRPDTFGGSYVDILGWGTVEYGGTRSDKLLKITVSVITNIECVKSYPQVTRNEMCTYGPDKDACQFDSGGAVLWQNPSTRRIVLAGIVAYGSICGTAPGVNTRVGGFMDWIVAATPDAFYCTPE